MATATLQKSREIPPVTLQLSGQEAEALHAVLGPISGAGGQLTYPIYSALHEALEEFELRQMFYTRHPEPSFGVRAEWKLP